MMTPEQIRKILDDAADAVKVPCDGCGKRITPTLFSRVRAHGRNYEFCVTCQTRAGEPETPL